MKSRYSPHWLKFAAASLLSIALAGCGGSDGAPGATGPAGSNGATGATGPTGSTGAPGKDLVNMVSIASNATPSTAAAAAAWQSLAPQVAVTGVSIAANPVVSFTVKDAAGKPVVGLGNKSQSATAQIPGLTNLAFTLAKLVPGTNNEPSKWVSYLVVRVPTVAEKAATPAGSSCDKATGATWCGTYPSSDNQGTLVDNGDGSYKYTFYRDIKQAATLLASLTDSVDTFYKKADAGDVSYDATLTHRLGLQLGGAAPGTGSNTPNGVTNAAYPGVNMVNTANAVYDFRPDGAAVTNTRDIVKIESCSACHDGKVLAHGSRKDPKYCMTCHTEQVKYGFNGGEAASTNGGLTLTGTTRPTTAIMDGRAIGNYPNMIHKTHMGEELVKTGYFFNAAAEGKYNEVRFPQDPANCTKCHDGSATAVNKTANGDNWKNVPSLLACGACHDGINFATGKGVTLADKAADVAAAKPVGTTQTGHIGGAKTNNAQCVLCHDATSIPVDHRSNFATPNNPTAKAGLSTFTYDIKSVSVNATTGQPTIVFQIKKDGVTVTSLAVPTLVTHATSGQKVVSAAYEPIPGFASGPSLYVAYAVPQDGITAPADFNVNKSVSLTNLLIASGSPKAGSITGPDGSGYFTAVLTGDTLGQAKGTCAAPVAPATAACVITAVVPAPLVIPAAAKMVTGAIIGSFTQKAGPGFATYVPASVTTNPTTNASGGQARPAILKKLVATGYTARRVIVDSAKCNSCHDQLGTQPYFHSGARNDATSCNFCHNNTQTSGGWSSNSNTFIHGIHGSSKRTVGYTWQSALNYSTLGYPGVLADCNQCHVPNAVNYGTSGASLQPNLMSPTVATGTTTAAGASTSPYIAQTAGTKYGLGYSYTTPGQAYASYTLVDGTVVPAGTAGATGFTREAEATTLVSSPISSACFSCHDTASAKAHMTTNGGAVYEARATAKAKSEACLTCHGAGKEFDAAVVHN